MTGEEIKNERQRLVELIKDSEYRIKELKSICKHESVKKLYLAWTQWEPAHLTDVCVYCNQAIKKYDEIFPMKPITLEPWDEKDINNIKNTDK